MSKQILPLSEEVRAKLRSGITINTTAQCVEELVLNSLDAEATCVAVRIDLAIFRIQVVDNGYGISKENLKMLGKRYATSKCHTLNDLNTNLGQYGFRGEAIASLVDVAGILDITTKHRSSTDTNTKLFAYGKEKSLHRSKVPRPSFGTTVTVQDFMFNMPVRRKRIRESIEIENIRIRLESFALMHPEISFSLRNDRKNEKVMQTHKGKNAVTAFMQLYGHDRAQSLVEVTHLRDQFDINGYISIQPYVNKSLQYIYINKRVVLKTRIHSLMNDLLSHSAIISKKLHPAGVSAAGSSGSGKAPGSPSKGLKLYGIFILNIECPLDEYDICLDPSKTLVEFRDWHKILLTVEEWVLKFCQEENILISLDERYRRSGKDDNIPEEEISPSQPHSSQEKLQVFSLKRPGDKSSNTCLAKEKYGRTISVHDFQSVVTSLPACRVKQNVTPEDSQHDEEILDDVMGNISYIENDQQICSSNEDSLDKTMENPPKKVEGTENIISEELSSSTETDLNQSLNLIEEQTNQNKSLQNKNGKRNISQESEFHLRKKNATKSSLDLIRQIVGSEDTIDELSTSHSSCEGKSDYECEKRKIENDVLGKNKLKVCDETLSLMLTPTKSPEEEVSKAKPEKKLSSLQTFRQFHQTHLRNLDDAPSRTPEESIIKTPNAPPPIITKSVSPDSDYDFSKNKINNNILNKEAEKKVTDYNNSDLNKNRLKRDINNKGFEKYFNDSDEEDFTEDNINEVIKDKSLQKQNTKNKTTATNMKDKRSLIETRTLSSVLKEGLMKRQQKEKALNSLQKFQFKKCQTSKDGIMANNCKEKYKYNINTNQTKKTGYSLSSKCEQKPDTNNDRSNDEIFHFSPVISITTDSIDFLQTGCQSKVNFDFSAIHENILNTAVNNPPINSNHNNLLGCTVSSALPIISSKVPTKIVAEINLNDTEPPEDVNDLPISFNLITEKNTFERELNNYSHNLDNVNYQSNSNNQKVYNNIANDVKKNIYSCNKSISDHKCQVDQQDTSTYQVNCGFKPSQGFMSLTRETRLVEGGNSLKVFRESDIYNDDINHQIIGESQGFMCDEVTQANSRNNSQFAESEGFSIESVKPSGIVKDVILPSILQMGSFPLDHRNKCEKKCSSDENSFSSMEKCQSSTFNSATKLKVNEEENYVHETFNTNNGTAKIFSSFNECPENPIMKQTTNMNNIVNTNSTEMALTTTSQDISNPNLSESLPSLHLSQLVYSESSKNDSKIPSSQFSDENNYINLNDLIGSISPKSISFGSPKIDYERDNGFTKENLELSPKKALQDKDDSNENISSQKSIVINSTESADVLLCSSDSQNLEPNCSEDYFSQTQKQISSEGPNSQESKGKNVWKEIVDDRGRKVYINLLTGNSSYDPPVIPETPEQCDSQGMSEPPLRIPLSDEPWFEQLGKNKNNCRDFVLSHGYSAFMSFKKRRELAAKENNKYKCLGDKEIEKKCHILDHEKSDDITGSSLSTETHDALKALLLENDNEEESIKWLDKPSSLSKDTENESNIPQICQLWEAPNFAMDVNIAATESNSTEQTTHKKNSAIRVYNIVHPYKFTREMLQSCEVIGQLDKKFIACNMKYDPSVYIDAIDKRVRDIVVLFDQHAVHERVRLETIITDNHELLPSGDKAIRSALVTPPMEMYLQRNEVRLMEAYNDIFKKLGLQYVKVNSTKVTFHSVPSCLVAREASEMRHRRCQMASSIVETLVREVCHTVHETGGIAPRLPKTLSHVLNSQACRGAVKFGDELTHSECSELIKSLSRCQLPFQCAHGRPSIVPIVDMTHMTKFSRKTTKPNIKILSQRMKEQEKC